MKNHHDDFLWWIFLYVMAGILLTGMLIMTYLGARAIVNLVTGRMN